MCNSWQVTASRITTSTGVNKLKRPYGDAPDTCSPYAVKGPAQCPLPWLILYTTLQGDGRQPTAERPPEQGRHLWESQPLTTELQLLPGSHYASPPHPSFSHPPRFLEQQRRCFFNCCHQQTASRLGLDQLVPSGELRETRGDPRFSKNLPQGSYFHSYKCCGVWKGAAHLSNIQTA